jgi:hypothetical protein
MARKAERVDADMFTEHDDSHVWSDSLCWTCFLTGRITERERRESIRED